MKTHQVDKFDEKAAQFMSFVMKLLGWLILLAIGAIPAFFMLPTVIETPLAQLTLGNLFGVFASVIIFCWVGSLANTIWEYRP